jgi:hypothetical protein
MNSAPLDISASTFSANSAVAFGAAHLQNSQFSIVNTTFSGNLATQESAACSRAAAREQPDPEQHLRGQPGAWRSGNFSAAMFGDSYFPISNSVFSNNTNGDPWNPMQHRRRANGSGDMQWPSTRTIGGAPIFRASTASRSPTRCSTAASDSRKAPGSAAYSAAPDGTGAGAVPSSMRQNHSTQTSCAARCTIGAIE